MQGQQSPWLQICNSVSFLHRMNDHLSLHLFCLQTERWKMFLGDDKWGRETRQCQTETSHTYCCATILFLYINYHMGTAYEKNSVMHCRVCVELAVFKLSSATQKPSVVMHCQCINEQEGLIGVSTVDIESVLSIRIAPYILLQWLILLFIRSLLFTDYHFIIMTYGEFGKCLNESKVQSCSLSIDRGVANI